MTHWHAAVHTPYTKYTTNRCRILGLISDFDTAASSGTNEY